MKTKILLSLLAISVLCFSQKASAQGGVLQLDSTVSGEVSGTNVDYWKVTIPKDGKITTTIASTNGTVINDPLYDANHQRCGYHLGGNGGGDGLAAGVYYVGVTSYYGNQTCDYTLSAHFTPAPLLNDTEPNNMKEQALTLPLNSSKTGHIGYYYSCNNLSDYADWYKITTNDGQLNLTLIPNVGHYIQWALLDSDGVHNIVGALSADTTTISKDGLAAGTYYIGFNLTYNPDDYSFYTLSDNLQTYNYAADAEPNDYASQAQIIPPNGTVTGHVGFYETYNSSDGGDWWKIIYTGAGSLTLKFNEERRISDNQFSATEFRVYSDTTKDPVYFATFTDSANVANLEGLTPGIYWILVSPSVNYRSFTSYSITGSFITLPVTFISFNGKLNNNEALLTWSTATEINNKVFEVQKSMDGQTFAAIGFVPSHGNSSVVNNYNFMDIKILSGSNYYRLKQIDLDGKFTYSSVIKLDYSKFDWKILGNPTTNNSWVQVQLDKPANVSVQIISINGSVIQTINKGKIGAGTYSIPLNMGNANEGTYLVRLVVDNKNYSKKIIK